MLALVVFVHLGALALFFYASHAKEPEVLELPRVQGILLPAPPAEKIAIPSAPQVPDTPVTLEPPKPEVKPKPQPKPEPKKTEPIKPEPLPEPVVEQPSVMEEAMSEESQASPSAPPLAEASDEPGAPLTPPEDAAHLNNPRPAYPSLSRRLREEGTVLLNVLIRADGSVAEVEIKQSSGFKRLDDTAVKAVRQWRYLPARRGNQPVDAWHLQPVEFSLK
jgi:protein TonB